MVTRDDWYDDNVHRLPVKTEPALWTYQEGWNETDIPIRPWIAKGYFMRGAVSVFSGPGSAGKSSLMVAYASALSLGVSFNRMTPTHPMRVVSYNVEDDLDEQRRRISAICRQLGRTPAEVMKNLALVGPSTTGALLSFDHQFGVLANTQAMNELEEFISEYKPDVVMLDPFVELHAAEENDNTAVRAVMARLRGIASTHQLSLVLLHHSRKGAASPGDPDSLRGASSIVGAARIALTLNVMTEVEATDLGIPADHRRDYFRLDGAKSNYAPIGDAEWFERQEYLLENGDGVAAAMPWSPPITKTTGDVLDRLEKLISDGSPVGPWSARFSDDPRSFARACERVGIDGRAQQKSALADLKSSRGVTEEQYKRPGKGVDERKGLRSASLEPSNVEWA